MVFAEAKFSEETPLWLPVHSIDNSAFTASKTMSSIACPEHTVGLRVPDTKFTFGNGRTVTVPVRVSALHFGFSSSEMATILYIYDCSEVTLSASCGMTTNWPP